VSGGLVLVGAGGHAKVIVGLAGALGLRVEAVLDDDAAKWGGTLLGVPIRGPMASLVDYEVPAVVAVGSNRFRRQMAEAHPDRPWATLVHPHAWVHPTVKLGPGTVVFAGAVIQPEATLGAHVILNTGATVDHDCRIGDYVHLAPGSHLAGSVEIGEGCFLGIASAAVPGVRVGPWTTLGAGAVAVRDIPANCTAVGLPAKPLPPKA
jgi:sugar O-acyltransferase (sialic acid O-acetyltransferase NeuD family)